MPSTTIIAFDQHAATTVAAVLLPGQRMPALHTLASESPTMLRFIDRLRRQGPIRCCYEAGPCGCELRRALSAHGLSCDVIAPALIPRRAGDRIKTDHRDAGQLAVLYRAGALTAIHIPREQEEAARDLLRCREDIRADLLRARHRLAKFLLRHGRRFTATKKAWSQRHDRWLRAQTWSIPALDQTHRADLRAVDEILARLRDVEADLRAVPDARAAPAAGGVPAVLPRHRRPHRPHHRRRTGGSAALSDGAAHDGIRRSGPLRAVERDETRPRGDHQNRQRAPAARLGGSGVALPPSPLRRSGAPAPSTRRARAGYCAGVAHPAAPVPSLSAPRGTWEAQATSGHGSCPGAHRLPLGRADPVI
jgi:Transposase